MNKWVNLLFLVLFLCVVNHAHAHGSRWGAHDAWQAGRYYSYSEQQGPTIYYQASPPLPKCSLWSGPAWDQDTTYGLPSCPMF
jgi:hypothetical protein